MCRRTFIRSNWTCHVTTSNGFPGFLCLAISSVTYSVGFSKAWGESLAFKQSHNNCSNIAPISTTSAIPCVTYHLALFTKKRRLSASKRKGPSETSSTAKDSKLSSFWLSCKSFSPCFYEFTPFVITVWMQSEFLYSFIRIKVPFRRSNPKGPCGLRYRSKCSSIHSYSWPFGTNNSSFLINSGKSFSYVSHQFMKSIAVRFSSRSSH